MPVASQRPNVTFSRGLSRVWNWLITGIGPQEGSVQAAGHYASASVNYLLVLMLWRARVYHWSSVFYIMYAYILCRSLTIFVIRGTWNVSRFHAESRIKDAANFSTCYFIIKFLEILDFFNFPEKKQILQKSFAKQYKGFRCVANARFVSCSTKRCNEPFSRFHKRLSDGALYLTVF